MDRGLQAEAGGGRSRPDVSEAEDVASLANSGGSAGAGGLAERPLPAEAGTNGTLTPLTNGTHHPAPSGAGAAQAEASGDLEDLRARLEAREAEIAALHEALAKLQRRLDEDLRVAASVQRALLPPPRAHDGLEIAREFLPFREIGGDYFDVVELSRRRLAIAIGDVMGKGVPAALLAANLKASLRAHLPSADAAPAELVARVNKLFFEVTPRARFATFFLGIFDPASGRLDYVNAGHDYPFVVREDGTCQDLVAGGTVLGLIENACYEDASVELQRGDLAVFFTDGVCDRENGLGELFGACRLKLAAARSRPHPARIALYSLLGEVQDWATGCAQQDDLTLLVAKRT